MKSSCIFWWALYPMTGVLIRERRKFTDQREGHVKTRGRDGSDADTRHADSHQKSPKAGRGIKISFPRASRGCPAWFTPWFQTCASWTVREELLCFKSPVCSNVTAALENYSPWVCNLVDNFFCSLIYRNILKLSGHRFHIYKMRMKAAIRLFL